jgi:hypothetical protein
LEWIRNYFLSRDFDVIDNSLEGGRHGGDWLVLRNDDSEEGWQRRQNPDLLVARNYSDKEYFVEVKSNVKYISARQLLYNLSRSKPVIYTVGKDIGVFATELVKTPERYFREAKWNNMRKPMSQDLIDKIVSMISPLELEITNEATIGDACLKLRYDPLPYREDL